MTDFFAQVTEQYRSQLTRGLWEQHRGSVRIAPEVAAVIGDRPPDSLHEDSMRKYHGPSWLEKRTEIWLFFSHTWFEEMRRERHKVYFKWNTEPMVGCWVWVDDGPAVVRHLTVEEARKWEATDD